MSLPSINTLVPHPTYPNTNEENNELIVMVPPGAKKLVVEQEDVPNDPKKHILTNNSFNPLTILYVRPSERINCLNACEYLQQLDLMHERRFQQYSELLNRCSKIDTNDLNIIMPKVAHNSLRGGIYGYLFGTITGSLLFSPFVAGIVTMSSCYGGAVIGGARTLLGSYKERPKVIQALVQIYKREIENAMEVVFVTEQQLQKIDAKILKAGEAETPLLKEELAQLSAIQNHFKTIIDQALNIMAEVGTIQFVGEVFDWGVKTIVDEFKKPHRG